MERLKFICIEDDIEFAEILKMKVLEYFQHTNFVVTVDVFHDIPNDIDFNKIDGCFFDIQIGTHDTIDYMKSIKEEGAQVPFILISNYENYIFEAVHLQIFDFIRKSKFDEEFKNALNHLQEYLKYKSQSILIPYKGNTYRIFINDIFYVKVISHRIIIHCKYNKNFEIWKSYDDIFKEKYSSLIRTHKSYVVNINYCYKIDKEKAYIRELDIDIPISNRNYKIVLEKFTEINSLLK